MLPIPVILALVYFPLAVLFLLGAVYLQRTGSLNLAKMESTADRLGLSAEFGKFKIQTNYPVIGIMIIALVCAVAPPAYELYLDSDSDPYVGLFVPTYPASKDVHLFLAEDERFKAGSLVQIPAFLSQKPISYRLSERDMCPTTIDVYYDKNHHALVVEDNTHIKTWTITNLQHAELPSPVELDPTGCERARPSVPDASPAPLVTRPGLPAPAAL